MSTVNPAPVEAGVPVIDLDAGAAYGVSYAATAELVAGEQSPAFLPLGTRRVLYVVALAATVVAPVLAISAPEYAAAIVTAGGTLQVAALGTALANPAARS